MSTATITFSDSMKRVAEKAVDMSKKNLAMTILPARGYGKTMFREEVLKRLSEKK